MYLILLQLSRREYVDIKNSFVKQTYQKMIKKYDYIIYCFLRDCMVSDCRFKGLVSPEKKSESIYHLLSAMAHKNKLRFYGNCFILIAL